MRQVGNEVLHDFHVRQRRDPDLALQLLDRGGAGEPVRAFHVHRARSADALAAGAAEGQGRVDLVLDLDERVEDHRPAFVEVDGVLVVARIGAGVGVVAVDFEGPKPLAFFGLPVAAAGDLAVLGKGEFGHGEPLARGQSLFKAAPRRARGCLRNARRAPPFDRVLRGDA